MESRPAEPFRTSALKKHNDEDLYMPSSVTRFTVSNNGPSPFLTSNHNTLQENSLASSGVKKGRTTKSRLGGSRGLFSEIEHSLADFRLPSRTAKKKQMDAQFDSCCEDIAEKENVQQDTNRNQSDRTEVPETGRQMVENKKRRDKKK